MMRFLALSLQLVIFLFLGIQISHAQKSYVINELFNPEQEVNLSPFLYVVEDDSAVLFSESDLYINQSHRLKVVLENKFEENLNLVVRFGERYLKVSEIEVTSNQSESKKIEFAGSIDIYLRIGEKVQLSFTAAELIKNDPQLFSVRLLTKKLMLQKTQFMYFSQALVLGVFGFLCLFNLVIFFVTRWRIYLKYTLYIFFSILYFSYFYGFIQIIFPEIEKVSNNLIQTWYSLVFISYFYFINDFGKYKIYAPKAYKLFNFGIVFKLFESSLRTVLHLLNVEFIYSSTYHYCILVFEICLMLMIIFTIVKNKNFRGRLVIGVSLILTLGGIGEELIVIKAFENSYFMEMAVLLELFIFSIALGYFTKMYKDDHEQSHELYVKQLKENKKLQINLSEELRKKVKQKGSVLNHKTAKKSIFLKLGYGHKKIDLPDILYLEANGSYCIINTVQGNSFTHSLNLRQTAEIINSEDLLRIHRSFIINKNHIESYNSKSLSVGGIELPIGKSYSDEVQEELALL